MKTNIIGHREIFGIEYSILEAAPILPYGHCRIWLMGNFLGDIEEPIFLTSTCSSLEGLIIHREKYILDRHYFSLSEQEKFELFDSGETKDYGFLYIEGYDAFCKYIYYRQSLFYFLWKLSPQLKGQENYQNVPKELRSAKISLPIYEEVVREFRNVLNDFLDVPRLPNPVN